MVARPKRIDWQQPLNMDHPLASELVACWDVGSDSPYYGGSLLRDLVPLSSRGGGNHGTLTNGPTWSGRHYPSGRGSIALDGTDDYVTAGLSSSSQFNIGTGAYSFGGWYRYNSVNDGVPFMLATGVAYYGVYLIKRGTYLAWERQGDTSWLLSSFTPSADTWYHSLVTWNGSNSAKFYLNGIEVASNTVGESSSFTANEVVIGCAKYGGLTFNLFGGNVDHVTLHKREISASEAPALYQESLQGNPNLYNWIRRPVVFDVGGGGSPTYFPETMISVWNPDRTPVAVMDY